MKPYRLILLSLALTLCSTLLYAAVPTISYTPSAYTFTYGTPITTVTPTLGNAPTSFTIIGSLPAGLTFNTTNGQISGTPTEVRLTPETYTITASNASGLSTPATITIQVNKADQLISFNKIWYQKLGATVTPPISVSSGLAFTITSDNPSVATVNNGIITCHSIGTANITVNADGNTYYNPALPVTQKLVVGDKPHLTLTNKDNISLLAGDPVNLQIQNAGGEVRTHLLGHDQVVVNRLGTNLDADGNPNQSRIYNPVDIVNAGDDTFYFSDYGHHKIKKLTVTATDTLTSSFAGSGTQGSAGGIGASAQFYYPTYLALDNNNNLLVSDNSNSTIRKIDLSTINVSTYKTANINRFAINSKNEIYFCYGQAVYKIKTDGTIIPYIGSTQGNVQGDATVARLNGPSSVICDPNDTLYVADSGNNQILQIAPGTVPVSKIIAGNGQNQYNTAEGDALLLPTVGPSNLHFDNLGNILFYEGSGGNTKIIKGTGSKRRIQIAFNSGYIGGYGYCFDKNGDSYVCRFNYNQIMLVGCSSYRLLTPLPASLSFDPKTATITGTPNTSSGSTVYQIAAYNQFGGDTIKVTMVVSKKSQTIALPTSKTITYGDQADQLPTTTAQGLAVSYTTSPTGIVSIGTDGKITVLKAGTVTITANQSGSAVYNALPNGTSTTLTINKKQLSYNNLTHNLTTFPNPITKTYNGTKTVPGTFTAQAADFVTGETVTLTAAGSYTSTSAGTPKVIVKYTLDATSATKYLPPADTQLDGKITPAPLTVSTTVTNSGIKTYNGNRIATITNGSLSGFQLGTDQAKTTLNVVSALYESKDASSSATNKITVTYSLSGDSAKNYDPPVDYYYDGKILPYQLTVSPPIISTITKPYDGTKALKGGYTKTALSGTYPDIIDYDITSCAYTTPNVVDGKIQVQYAIASTIDPAIAKNYTAPSPSTITLSGITALKLKLKDITIPTEKPYDGTTTTTATAAFENVVGSESVTPVLVSAVYDQKDASDNPIPVTVTFGMQGTSTVLNNYSAPDPVKETTKNYYIRKRQLTIGEPTLMATTKPYDGTTTFLGAYYPSSDLKEIVGTERVFANIKSVNYKWPDVGTWGIDVAYELTGNDSRNYLAPTTATVGEGKINPLQLTVSGTDATPVYKKTYNGNADIDISKITNIGSFDNPKSVIKNVTLKIAKAYYDRPSAESGKNITVEYSLEGTGKGNYLTPPSNNFIGVGTISPAQLTVGEPVFTTKHKTYDTTTELPSFTLGKINEDYGDGNNLTLEVDRAYYDGADAGPHTITIQYKLSGSAAANYIKPGQYTATDGRIDQKQLSIVGSSIIEKPYDGTLTATAVAGELDTYYDDRYLVRPAIKSANYISADAGTTSVKVSYTLTGSKKGNYLAPADETITGPAIKKLQLTVSGTVPKASKEYNGNTDATLTTDGNIDNKPLNGSKVELKIAKAYYNSKDVRTAKDITVEYQLVEESGKANYETPKNSYFYDAGKITPYPLEVTDPSFDTADKSKVYNSRNDLPSHTLGKFKKTFGTDSDNMTLEASNEFYGGVDAKEQDITIEYRISGLASDNYIKPVPYKNKGLIKPKQLSITGTKVADKNYDGSSTATATPGTLYVVEPYDVGSVYPVIQSATYRKTEVGTQSVDIVYNLEGEKKGNYLPPLNETITGNIKSNQLVLDKLDFESSKPYDGTRTAKVNTATALTDDGKTINLVATATYDNANAGPQDITFTFGLEGADKDKYVAPASEKKPGRIEPIKLRVKSFLVQTNKITDGTSYAKVLNNGELKGVIPAEAGLITHQTTATYQGDITPGTATKTILVNFTCTGMTSNYEAPESETISGALIADKIVLNLSPVEGAGCDGYITLPYSVVSGDPLYYQISFSDEAKAAGFKDIATNLLKNGEITIDIPKGTSSGHYKGTLVAKTDLGESAAYPFFFDVNVATNLIVSKFNSEVVCDNSSRQYTAYQWYKNGNAIHDANLQYYEDPEGLVGTYSVLVTNIKGESVMSCPRYFNFPIQKSLKVYPSPVQKLHQCKIDLSQLKADELENAVMTIYTPQGVKVYETTSVSSENYFKPLQTGVYVGTVMLKNGFRYNFSIIAKE